MTERKIARENIPSPLWEPFNLPPADNSFGHYDLITIDPDNVVREGAVVIHQIKDPENYYYLPGAFYGIKASVRGVDNNAYVGDALVALQSAPTPIQALRVESGSIPVEDNNNVHLMRAMRHELEYSREFAHNGAKQSFMYPDSGSEMGVDTNEYLYNLRATVFDAGTGEHVIQVGDNTTGAQPGANVVLINEKTGPVAGSGLTFNVSPNPAFNEGFKKRWMLSRNSQDVYFTIPLSEISQFVASYKKMFYGTTLKLTLTPLTNNYFNMQRAGNLAVMPKLVLEEVQLYVPQYRPRAHIEAQMKALLLEHTIATIYFPSWEIIAATQIPYGSPVTEFSVVISENRRVNAVIVCYHAAEGLNGSSPVGRRTFHANITSGVLTVGTKRVPSADITSNFAAGDARRLYQMYADYTRKSIKETGGFFGSPFKSYEEFLISPKWVYDLSPYSPDTFGSSNTTIKFTPVVSGPQTHTVGGVNITLTPYIYVQYERSVNLTSGNGRMTFG